MNKMLGNAGLVVLVLYTRSTIRISNRFNEKHQHCNIVKGLPPRWDGNIRWTCALGFTTGKGVPCSAGTPRKIFTVYAAEEHIYAEFEREDAHEFGASYPEFGKPIRLAVRLFNGTFPAKLLAVDQDGGLLSRLLQD